MVSLEPLQLRVDVQHARDPGLEAAPGGGFRIRIESLVAVAPALLAAFQRDFPGTLSCGLAVKDRLELFSEDRVLHQHALLAIQPGRSRVEIVAADKQRLAVDRNRLGMQARARGTAEARLHVAARQRLELPELHAALEQRIAVA